MAVRNGPIVRFDEFTLDLDKRILHRCSERVRLTSKPMETLVCLVENRGRTVEKQQLMDVVWRDTFVTEDNIVHAIREIRRALGDDKAQPRFIQTVPRQGYRFVGDLKMAQEPASDVPRSPDDALSARPGFEVGPAPSRKRSPGLFVGFLIVMLIGTAVGWHLLARKPSGSGNTPPASSVGAPKLRYLTPGIRSAIKPVFSPDGKFMLYVSSDLDSPGVLDLYVRPVDEGNAIRITDRIHASGDMPVFTGDGTHVVFSRYRSGSDNTLPDLWTVPVSGGSPRVLIAEAGGAGFSADGKWVAYTKYLPGGPQLWLSPTSDLSDCRSIAASGFTPRWSPDGRWIAYTTGDPNQDPGCVWIVSISSLARRQLTTNAEQIYGLAWTADSRSVIYAPKTGGLYHLPRVPIEGGDVQPLVTGVGEYLSPSVSPDGKHLIFCYLAPVRDLTLTAPAAGSEEKTVTDGEYHSWPRFSPTGNRIASILRRAGEEASLFITEPATGAQAKVSDRAAAYPAWVDEDRVAYLAHDEGSRTTEIRIGSVRTGVNSTWMTLDGDAAWLAPHPSRTKAAVVIKSADGRESIVLCEPAQSSGSVLANGGRYAYLRWLPDGRFLSWSGPGETADPANSGIWILGLDQSSARKVFADGYGPVWAPDGQTVYFARIGENSGLWRLRVPETHPVRLRSWEPLHSYDIAGGRLVFAGESGRGQIYSLALNEILRSR